MIRKDETGAALPLTLAIIIVLTLLGIMIITYSTSETRQVALEENRMKALYIARSGAHAVADYMINNPDEIDKLLDSGESKPVTFGDGQYIVKVEPFTDNKYPDEILYQVISTGTLNTGTGNEVLQQVNVRLRTVPIDFALYANEMNFTALSGSAAEIKGGDVVYGGGSMSEADQEKYDKLIKDGELILDEREFPSVILPCEDPKMEELDPAYFGSCPVGNAHGSHDLKNARYVKIEDSSLFGSMDIKGDSKPPDGYPDDHNLWIKPPAGQNLLLKADNIHLGGRMVVELDDNIAVIVVHEFTQNEDIYIKGKGHLLLYVHNYDSSGNKAVIVDNNDVYLNVYVYSDADGEGGIFDISGTTNFYGSIYAPDAKSVISGTSEVVGWIITDEVIGQGGVSITFNAVKTIGTSMDIEVPKILRWHYQDR